MQSNNVREHLSDEFSDQIVTTVILLETNHNEQHSRTLHERLFKLADNFLTFSSIDNCLDYISQSPTWEKIQLVVTNNCISQPIVENLKKLNHINSLFIVDEHTHCHEEHSHRFNNIDSLINHVETITDESKYSSISFSFFDQQERSLVDLSTEATTFMWTQLALNVLLILPSKESAIDDMLSFCSGLFSNDSSRLEVLQEFRRTYTSKLAIQWYSRPSCIFRLVNRVLRTEDISGLFLFHQFIVDLHNQIVEEQQKQRQLLSIQRVYRGQFLPNSELEHMQKATGKLLSSNGFISTSRDRNVAELYISKTPPTDQASVLFIIDVDMSLESTLCADISTLSVIPAEYEVLFTLSAVFRLNNVVYDKEHNRWEVFMITTDEGREIFEEYKCIIFENIRITNPYLIFGQIILQRGLYKKASIYYESLQALLPADDLTTRTKLNIDYSRSLFFQGKYDEALAILTETERMFEKLGQGSESLDYLRCQFNIANVYMYKNKYECALEIYRRTLNDQRKLISGDHRDIADTLSGISWALEYNEHIEEALDYSMQSLAMRQSCLPSYHPTITHTLRAIGHYHESQGRWLEAQDYFSQSYATVIKYLPPTHVRCAFSLLHFGLMSENRGEYDNAFGYYTQALRIYEHNFKDGHPSLAHTLDQIGNIHRRKKEFHEASQCLERALNMRNRTLAAEHLTFSSTFHNLANIYMDLNDNANAIHYFQRALEIKKKHLKPANPSIARTLSCLATAYSHQSQFEMAECSFQEALDIQQAAYPNGHPDIGITLHHMASNYCRMNAPLQALEIYRKSLVINENFFPPNHTEIALVEYKIQELMQQIKT
ncbi:unnamed protein product [Rotaria magnacalcarata]|uniref:NAD(P)(+)--arginine ADP-ribosyltransferase n=2 Tax=Rotaria magnacalcarata TaxID=392030 RepID=A0A816R5W4_9BILA|nr:unnamed protein product [Rotaria magnacalcarata]